VILALDAKVDAEEVIVVDDFAEISGILNDLSDIL
jgi:hypothetical protein